MPRCISRGRMQGLRTGLEDDSPRQARDHGRSKSLTHHGRSSRVNSCLVLYKWSPPCVIKSAKRSATSASIMASSKTKDHNNFSAVLWRSAWLFDMARIGISDLRCFSRSAHRRVPLAIQRVLGGRIFTHSVSPAASFSANRIASFWVRNTPPINPSLSSATQ